MVQGLATKATLNPFLELNKFLINVHFRLKSSYITSWLAQDCRFKHLENTMLDLSKEAFR